MTRPHTPVVVAVLLIAANVNRGIALYNGMVIAPSIDGRLFSLDALTGKPAWETRIVDFRDQYTLTMAPRIAVGRSSSERPVAS